MASIRNIVICISLLLLLISFVNTQQKQEDNNTDTNASIDEDEEQMNTKWQQYQMDHVKQVEDENTAIQTKEETIQIRQYKESIKKMIMDKAVEQNESENEGTTNNNFHSFLQMRRGIMGFESPLKFFGYSVTNNADALPISGQAKKPWSASYFPVRNGIISVRYNLNPRNTIAYVNNVGTITNYYTLMQSIYKYSQPSEHNRAYQNNNFEGYVNTNYSPSEKYDLLVGDNSYSLTNYLKRSSVSMAVNGDVPSWFGICHGVAPATYFFDKPIRPVTLTAADGKTNVRFLPDDIKALASQFWANVNFRTRFMGGRCNFTRGQSGWYTDPNCRSLNPASVLVTLGNMIGRNKQNLILDPNADPEIWNEAAYGYEMRYYNVLTNRFSATPSNVKVHINQIRNSSNPIFRKVVLNATPYTTHVVGVFMRISYCVNNQLKWDTSSNPDQYKTQGVDSVIELDRNNNIIGGEWKTDSYPNYMWRFDDKFPINGVSDKFVSSFNGSSSQLKSFTNYAKNASTKGQLLKAIVQYLVNSSR